MGSNRRGFIQSIAALPLIGGLLNWLAPTAAAAPVPDVYKELGVRPLINAAGTYTSLGGSLMPREVLAAMESAAGQFVDLIELHQAVGKRIASLVRCEAALVSAGAASALTLATAACIAGKEAAKIRRLPDTAGMKNEVIIQKSHRFGYDHAVRNAGARLVEVESAQDLERAVGDKTALLLFYNDRDSLGQIKVEEFARLGKKLGVPTLNDAAADVPPVEHLNRYFKMGYDLVVFSGGKGLRGPQAAGLLLGRKDLIEAAALNNNPHTDTVGRTCKVGKEEIVGMWAALDHYLSQDQKSLWEEWERSVRLIANLVSGVRGVKAVPFVPPIANHVPHLRLTWDAAALGQTPADVVKRLREGTPRIEVRPLTGDGLELAVWMLEPGQDLTVGRRLREVLEKKNDG